MGSDIPPPSRSLIPLFGTMFCLAGVVFLTSILVYTILILGRSNSTAAAEQGSRGTTVELNALTLDWDANAAPIVSTRIKLSITGVIELPASSLAEDDDDQNGKLDFDYDYGELEMDDENEYGKLEIEDDDEDGKLEIPSGQEPMETHGPKIFQFLRMVGRGQFWSEEDEEDGTRTAAPERWSEEEKPWWRSSPRRRVMTAQPEPHPEDEESAYLFDTLKDKNRNVKMVFHKDGRIEIQTITDKVRGPFTMDVEYYPPGSQPAEHLTYPVPYGLYLL